jgi:PAS domain S-box-containing protein
MAQSGRAKGTGKRGAPPAPARAEPLPQPRVAQGRTPEGYEPLVTALGGGTLDFSAMLAIADILPVMVAYVDRALRYRFINKPLADWLGWSRKEVIGRHLRDVLGPGPFRQRRPLYEKALGGERVFFASEFEHRARGPLAVQTDYVPWADANGEVRGLIIVVQDVTEQRTAERALRESEERFRRIANSAPALMWVTRLDRTRDFVNDAYMEFLGTDDREFARAYDWRVGIHPDDIERIVAESLAGEESLKTFALEGRFRRGDGGYSWLKSVSSPRFGPDGELVGFIGVATDITLAKEAELELKAQVAEQTRELALSEARFRAVFDTVLEVLVLMEPDGTVVELNRKQTAWRATNARDGVGQKIWDAPTLRNYPQHIALMKRAVKQAAAGRLFAREVTMERDGAATAFLDISVQPVRDGDGKVIYLLFEARDITDLKAAQEQLRQSQKMEALGQLTGGIAHDFNNLLTVVVGGLDIIAKRAADDKLKRYAVNALAAAERGARLTGQLLAFSRVQRLEVRPTPIGPLIESMSVLLRDVIGPGITKEFALGEEMVPILADPTQLEVAVLNLAINARDAMPDGGVLRFASRIVRVTADPELAPGKYVELTISDTGIGMTDEVLDRAFEPFFTTKEVGKGTGLGLSMVYGMARQSGGTARIDSAPGEGTAVRLYFRAAGGEAAAGSATGEGDAGDADAARGPASILVIDDDPDVRAFMVATLEEQGYRVKQAADGREGLSSAARDRPDLVILDFIMPGLSGADVANRLLAKRPDQPILFVSGYSETEAVRRVAPHAPLLAKPFRADALDKAVRGALAPQG